MYALHFAYMESGATEYMVMDDSVLFMNKKQSSGSKGTAGG